MRSFGFSIAILLLTPVMAFAQYHDSTSMDVLTGDSYARDCYRAASVAARIHYTSHEDLESCEFALRFSAMSLRDRAATLTNRGIIRMSLEDYEAAIQDYSSALKLKPEFGEIYVNIGNVYYMGKVFDKAIEEYTNAIDRQTTKIHIAYLNRGMAYENLEEWDNAEADYRAAMEIIPDAALPAVRLDQLLRKKAEKLSEVTDNG
jgi:tetratricopeptide (TPR) repeat protein